MQKIMRIIRVIRGFLVLLQHGSKCSNIRLSNEGAPGAPVPSRLLSDGR